MYAIARLPMFGLAALAFLLICAVIAVAVFFLFRSGEAGRTKLSGAAGCGVGCALLTLAGLMGLVVLLVVVVNLPGEALRRGPVERVELQFDQDALTEPEPPEPPADREERAEPSVHATLELRPGADAGSVLRLFRQRVSSGLAVTVRTVRRDDGDRQVIEIDVPVDARARREIRDLLRDLREEAPGLELPKGIVVEIRGPQD